MKIKVVDSKTINSLDPLHWMMDTGSNFYTGHRPGKEHTRHFNEAGQMLCKLMTSNRPLSVDIIEKD